MICTTIFLSSIFSNFSEMFKFILAEYQRLLDRGYKSNLKNDLEDEDDDEVNSKLKI